jgi:hypothetical protein
LRPEPDRAKRYRARKQELKNDEFEELERDGDDPEPLSLMPSPREEDEELEEKALELLELLDLPLSLSKRRAADLRAKVPSDHQLRDGKRPAKSANENTHCIYNIM